MLRKLPVLVPATLLAACAHTGTAPDTTGTTMTVWIPAAVTQYADADRDGKVTRKEASVDANLARSFDRYDTNDDGVLDRGEFAQLEGDSRRELQTAPVRREAPQRSMSLNRTGVDAARPESE